MNPLSLDIERLSAAYCEGLTNPEAVMAEVLARINAHADDHVWISRADAAAVMERARRLTRHGPQHPRLPLYGLPFAVKDNIDVAGYQTTVGCPAYSYAAVTTATVVDRLIKAGAIFIGKTNLDQFATGLVGVRSPYGIPRNPFDPAMIPGGSSSGSAVAVTNGLVSFAVGTDTAGSGRVPAAFNNVVGYKPTRGLFSRKGLVPACRSADCITLFALTVRDALTTAEVMKMFDPADPYSGQAPPRFKLQFRAPSTAFRFGIPNRNQLEFFSDREAERLFELAICRMVALGGELVEIDYAPWIEAGSLLYGPWVAERTAELGDFIETHHNQVHPVVRGIILGGNRVTAVELFRAEHRLAKLAQIISPVWKIIDFLLVPTTPTAYSIAEVMAEPVELNSRLGYYTTFTNLLNMAGIAIPNGFTSAGFPAGVTLIGPAWSDAQLAGYAGRFQRLANLPLGATGYAMPHQLRTDDTVLE
jgi:allophanate hydrolase